MEGENEKLKFKFAFSMKLKDGLTQFYTHTSSGSKFRVQTFPRKI